MGADDDEDCEHLWEVQEIHATASGAAMSSTCARCGAISYEPGQAARRPGLDTGGFAGT